MRVPEQTNRYEKKTNHTCFKNWSCPSASMESDLILEGFQVAEKQHGVRYMRFIGDGDSSVNPTLVANVSVWGYDIQKEECANHAVKCFRTSMEQLVKDKSQYKGRGKLTEQMRKFQQYNASSPTEVRKLTPVKQLNSSGLTSSVVHYTALEFMTSATVTSAK